MTLGHGFARAVLGALLLVTVLAATARDARANVTQPDGTVIPTASGAAVHADFAMYGDDTIDVVGEAATTPETYLPDCALTFSLIAHGAAYDDEFGWYNVTAGRAPTTAELHRMLTGGQAVGTRTVIDMSMTTGGPIGFYMRDNTQGHTYYSQRAYNPDRVMSSGYIHMLTWNSHAITDAFYFGWEDLFGAVGNDNDFDDMLVYVEGLTCTGGGAPCTVPHGVGACATGIEQCRAGTLGCVPAVLPAAEACDGIDNDCNGATDDGAGLCPAGQVCQHGGCVPRCVEAGCFEGQVCTANGTCVESACTTVTCPMGQRCVAGACRAPCDGVTCPHGAVCRDGDCVDPCAGVTCDSAAVCVAGVCQPRCICRHCAAGLTCETTGLCVDNACATVVCATGQYCTAGACHDPCEGATCPTGQRCAAGACSDARDGGTDAGFTTGDAGGRSDARADAGHGASPAGCGCGVGRGSARGAGALGCALLALCVRRRRRARYAAPPA